MNWIPTPSASRWKPVHGLCCVTYPKFRPRHRHEAVRGLCEKRLFRNVVCSGIGCRVLCRFAADRGNGTRTRYVVYDNPYAGLRLLNFSWIIANPVTLDNISDGYGLKSSRVGGGALKKSFGSTRTIHNSTILFKNYVQVQRPCKQPCR